MEITVTPIPAKLLIRSPLAPDCDFELRVERDLTSEERDTLFAYLTILRRVADRKEARARDIAETMPPKQSEER